MAVKTADREVRTVREAVAVAREWQNAGIRTWFRGHNKAEWPLTSSLVRVQRYKPETEGFVHARMGHFCQWLASVPELQYLLEPENTHAFFGILQHYGIPTHYVDFTTRPEIAGFFAACGPDVKPGETGCIIAIDPDEAVDAGRVVAKSWGIPPEHWPELVTVNVDNLYRMQAQSGHFLYLPFLDVEAGYCYDRILFRHQTEPPYDIPEHLIYPKRKSPLEVRLDQFFTAELMANNQIYWQHVFESWRAAGIRLSEAPLEVSDPTAYLASGHGPDPSWNKIQGGWNRPAAQTFQDAFTRIRVAGRTSTTQTESAELDVEDDWRTDR